MHGVAERLEGTVEEDDGADLGLGLDELLELLGRWRVRG